MKTKFNFTREIFHEILFLISLGFTEILFFGLGNWLVASIVFAVFGFAIEIEKRFLSRKVKRDFIDKNWKSLLPNALVLFIIISLSCIAAYGSMKTSIMEKINDLEVLDSLNTEEVNYDNIQYQIEQIDLKIERLNTSITSAQTEQNKMNEADDIYVINMKKMDDLIAEKEKEIKELLEQRTTFSDKMKKVETVEESKIAQYLSSSNTFKMIAEDFIFDINNVMKWILYVLVIVLEASLFLTVLPLNSGDGEVKKSEKEIFIEFIEKLFDNGGKKYLNSANKVSSMTGISLGQCKNWLNMLANIKMRGNRSLITHEKNGWTSTFPVSTVISVATKSLFVGEGE